MTTLSAADFAAKWQDNARRERASSQEHFIDLCRLIGAPTPGEADRSNKWYRFEAPAVRASTGKHGRADVWKRGYFVWEYKGANADLGAAYHQLRDYQESLENPPALVVSDMDRILVRTNFTNTQSIPHEITLDKLAAGGDDTAEALRILRAVMLDPEELRPQQTPEEVTKAAAASFAGLALTMRERGLDPESVAHFLNRVLFCLFAEDVGLLPKQYVTNMIVARAYDPDAFIEGITAVFRRMSYREASRLLGNDRIEWFNGGLFDDDSALSFTRKELHTVAEASTLDWSQVEPAILGTLFERGLDPKKRKQFGAHYTDREKILMVVEPVVMTPLRLEFAAMQERVTSLMKDRELSRPTREGLRRANLPKWEQNAESEWRGFLDRLRNVRVLDPACGSGNFLYVTLRLLKDLEWDVIHWGGQRLRITGEFPQMGPHNLLGIEKNPYAKELAGVAIWIGQIQWMLENGYGTPSDPVLQPLDNIELRDAILDDDEEGNPIPASWPEAEFIVGNPPFLGSKLLRLTLGDSYIDKVFAAWDDALDRNSDLACYWHELARRQIDKGHSLRAGLLATNSIRGGANRGVLEAIKLSGDLFMAWSDQRWVVEGAAVRVSIVGQDDGTEQQRSLDGEQVGAINPDLTAGLDLTRAKPIAENRGVCLQGDIKGGAFDITPEVARQMLKEPNNVNGRPNSDVVISWVNGSDITRRPRGMFIIDFGVEMSESEAAEFEMPFRYIEDHILPKRAHNREERTGRMWWLHQRPRPEMRDALAPLQRFIVTPRVSKHRLFDWFSSLTLPDSATFAIAPDDDYAFGVLHSRAHELWSLRLCTWLGVGNDPRYTPTTTFETFPFPWPLNTPDEALTSEQCQHRDAIGEAARELDEKPHSGSTRPSGSVSNPT